MENIFALVKGPMFAGKSSLLVRYYHQYSNVQAFKPAKDDRYLGKNYISTHSQMSIPCTPVVNSMQILQELKGDTALVLIDEAHFFDYEPLHYTIEEMKAEGINVIAAGVDTDHLGFPFETMDRLQDWADNIVEVTGRCEGCDGFSKYTARRHGFDQEAKILVGGIEAYRPLCGNCFQEHLISL